MAIEFARSNVISRSAGHSAVKAAAYRSGSDLMDDQIGRMANYGHRADDVVHSEILLPAGSPESLTDRVALWSAIEAAEDKSNRRASAQLAIDHIIALPRELSLEDQIALARDFAKSEFVSHGVAVDLNVHLHSQDNPHAHLMTTTRFVSSEGIGLKARALNGGFYGGRKVVDGQQIRHRWAAFQNTWARDRGLDLLVTNNNGQWAAEVHRGPTRHMDQRDSGEAAQSINPETGEWGQGGQSGSGEMTEKGQINVQVIEAREVQLADDATAVIRRVAASKSVFSRHDLYRELHKHVSDQSFFAAAKAKIDASEILIQLTGPGEAGEWFTTTETLDLENALAGQYETMASEKAGPVPTEKQITKILDKEFAFLSGEQREAVRYLATDKGLSAVVGLAGTGKSTMLDATRAVWKEAGRRVVGLALSGKAAEGLQGSAHIESSTIHSFLARVKRGTAHLSERDVYVIDEAGMVNSALMKELLTVISGVGAKVILVGDPDQLQPIQAGNPFRSVARRLGYMELGTIRRQRQAWAREATYKLARQETRAALELFKENGCFRKAADRAGAIEAIVRDTVSEWPGKPKEAGQKKRTEKGTKKGPARQKGRAGDSIVLAHANLDVAAINEGVRAALVARGLVKDGLEVRTADDKLLTFGDGDRVLFKRNSHAVGVKNGTLGTVKSTMFGKLVVQLDEGKRIVFDPKEDYADLAHGYATTIHKAQGVTVDRAKVLVTSRWDRHLSYVALSRHRDSVELYFGDGEFRGQDPYTKQARPGLTEVMGRDASEVSVTDFAAQHGLEIIDYKAVELPKDELQRRTSEAFKYLRDEIDRGHLEFKAERQEEADKLKGALELAKQANEEHLARPPSKLMKLFTGKRWEAKAGELAERVKTLDRSLRIVEYEMLDGKQSSVRQAVRKRLEHRMPRLFESMAVLKTRQSQAADLARQQKRTLEKSQGRTHEVQSRGMSR